MKQNGLPTFRQRDLSLSGLNILRRHHLPVHLLRTLSLIPAIIGITHNTRAAWDVPIRDSGGALILRSMPVDFWVANIWCILTGYWSWILTTSLMKRWLFHYEFKNAIVRMVALTAANWCVSAMVSSSIPNDEVIIMWVTCSIILLLANIWKIYFVPNPKYFEKPADSQGSRFSLKSTAVRVLLLPLAAAVIITMFAALQQMDQLQYTTSQLMHMPYKMDVQLGAGELATNGQVSILVLILSSWSSQSIERRAMLRKTTLKLLTARTPGASITYRFVVGQPPSAHAQLFRSRQLESESEKYHDMLVVPAPDLDSDRGRKLFEALRWADQLDYDYLVKTDDNVFVRWDALKSELANMELQHAYWKGLVYRNMPPEALGADKSTATDYPLPLLSTFTSGTLFTISRDVVNLIAGITSPRRFLANEDRNMAVWLFGFDINPRHDIRVLDDNVCEDDGIARRFKDNRLKDMEIMYKNIVDNKGQCSGFDVSRCALCYPCHGKKTDWRSQNLACDPFKGVTQRKQTAFLKATGANVKDMLSPSVIGKNDEWIIPNVLSTKSSKFSDTENWNLLYWVCWTSDTSTFVERHWKALELVWVHEPRAVIFMISNTLPQDFFDDYTKQGYEIYVVNFNKENLLKWHWYFGPGTLDWLKDWEKWEKGNFFYWHLTDYIRCLLLYNYGGTYMDMDALWIRIPEQTDLEFIGSDYSSLISDREWTLDDTGLYLPQGLMRFKRGWSLFRELCESAFSPYWYDPGCFNCGGPKAITSYVREHRASLEDAGFTILPRKVLYPVSYLDIHKLLQPNPLAEQELKNNITQSSWNIHLFGKMTNHLPIQTGSVVDVVFKKFDLDIPHRDAKTQSVISSTHSMTVPFKLIGPKKHIHHSLYQYASPASFSSSQANTNVNINIKKKMLLQPTLGKFQGLDVIYIRGGPANVEYAELRLEITLGKLQIGHTPSEPFTAKTISLPSTTKKEVNALLNSLIYTPDPLNAANGGTDRLEISVTYGNYYDKLITDVVVVETEDEDEADTTHL